MALGLVCCLWGPPRLVYSVLSAYSGSGLPGAFGLEQYNGTFFVAPNSQRDQTGATITVPPV